MVNESAGQNENFGRNENVGDVRNLVQAQTVGDVHIHNHRGEALRAQQLPPAPALFVDREDVLAELDAALGAQRAPDQALCVLVSGGSGTGKSALVARWVHGARARFDDVVYLDMRRRSVGLDEVLWHCLSALGEEYPGSSDAALALYRSKTSGRSVALVFDNVVQPRELLQLRPASSAALVGVISGRSMAELAVDGVLSLQVPRLDAAAGVDVLRSAGAARVDAEPAHARRLVELCGGLPIALRIVAGRLAKRPGWKLARVAAELEDDHSRLDRLQEGGEPVVRNALDRAVEELPQAQRDLYALLGNVPGPAFAADAVAALAGLTVDEAEDLLYELHDANLLERNDHDEFRFHDLVRLHAEEKRRVDAAALRRLADWYRLRGAYADRAVMEPQRFRVGHDDELLGENPFDHDSALEWLERERVNLLAVLDTAHQQGWDRVVISLCDSPVWTLHNQHKHYADTISALRNGVSSAERAQDLVAEARMRTLLVRLHTEQHDFSAAHEQAAHAREVAERAGHRRALASALEFHGRAHLEQSSWAEAIPLFRRARDLNAELGLPRAMALQEYMLGRALGGDGRPDDALRQLHSALDRLQDYPQDKRTPGRIRVAMGRVHQRLGDHAEAVRVLRAAESDVRARRVSHDLAEPLELLAESLAHIGETAAARECAAEALNILEQAGSPRAEQLREQL